jgi:hypothetical protein
MTDEKSSINTVGDVTGSHINIAQIYAPGAIEMRPQVFPKRDKAPPFSIDWLVFSQQSISFLGMEVEFDAVRAFLDAPVSFSWWMIVGNGGIGKSRFALEATKRLPEGWVGGFIAKENLTLRDAAAWRPSANTLWIVDDAAPHQAVLRQIIAAWEQLFRSSKFKVRIVFLERGFSKNSGWGSELTGGMSWETTAINQTLYQAPLVLAPLAQLARPFLSNLCDQLGVTAAERIRAELAKTDDKRLMEQSQFGNPLLLELIAAQLFTPESADAFPASATTAETIVEKHLERELDLLKARCEEAGVRFGAMLDLLFVTTSLFPIQMLLDFDTLVATDGKDVLLVKDNEGQLRLPTVREARSMGVDVSARNKPMLSNLSRITQIDDIDAYLTVLQEAGLASATRYSIQPDLVGGALLRLVLNTPAVPNSLTRRRGEFNRARVTSLVAGCVRMSYEKSQSAYGAWGRLEDQAILTIIDYLRLTGASIRLALLALRDINYARTTKVPFDPEFMFAPNNIHPNAHLVGRYWVEVRNAIDMEPLEEGTAARLSTTEHVWVLPYVYWLLDLTLIQRVQLGLIICNVQSRSILARLTNLHNFLHAITFTLSHAFTQERRERLSDAERNALGRLVDAALAFASERAYPTITAVGDETYKEVYQRLAQMLIGCSFGVANQLLGRTETEVSRQRAMEGLEIARLALRVAPSEDEIAYVDRNLAVLKVADVLDPSEAASVYLATLDEMQQYAGPEAFSAAIADLLILATARRVPELLSVVVPALLKAPRHLIRGELIAGPMVRSLFALIGDEQHYSREAYERLPDIIGPLCQVFSGALRATDSEDAAEDFLLLIQLALNASNWHPFVRDQLLDMFRLARASMDEGVCSPMFIDTILNAATQVLLLGSSEPADQPSEFAGKMAFEVLVSELAPEKWRHILFELSDESERELAGHIASIREAFAIYDSPDGARYVHTTIAPNIDDPTLAKDPGSAAILTSILSKLRLLS